jgi:hypothetical protein
VRAPHHVCLVNENDVWGSAASSLAEYVAGVATAPVTLTVGWGWPGNAGDAAGMEPAMPDARTIAMSHLRITGAPP